MTASSILVIKSEVISLQLQKMFDAAIGNKQHQIISSVEKLKNIKSFSNKKILLVVELDEAGYCLSIFNMISYLSSNKSIRFEGSIGAVIIHSPNELNTKSIASDLILKLNLLGCSFIGHPLIEATSSLSNFKTWQKTIEKPLEDICFDMCARLGERLFNYNTPPVNAPKLLALHSSHNKTSNTLALWHLIKKQLSMCDITELHVENGRVLDCKGCSFKTCMYFSSQSSCFYGGMMVEEIFPAIEKADIVVWICPNYNDAVSANLTAVINRLTALYRKTSFFDKAIYAVIVSGNSGSDSVARQLIDSLCINKGFFLPSRFCIMETANDPGAILLNYEIEAKATDFSMNIMPTTY